MGDEQRWVESIDLLDEVDVRLRARRETKATVEPSGETAGWWGSLVAYTASRRQCGGGMRSGRAWLGLTVFIAPPTKGQRSSTALSTESLDKMVVRSRSKASRL